MYSVSATRSRKHAGASKAEWRRQGGQSKFIVPSKAIVLESVRSLYADGLEPFGRIVLRRARELCAAARSGRPAGGDEGRCVDAAALRKICQEIPELEVVPLSPYEHRVLLVGVAGNFVDVGSNEDNYPPELWTAASTYLDGLRGSAAMLPGGRYACAVELIERRAPFTEGRSLGEVCHIVQLAVARHKLLGYSDGHMVPYSASGDAAKERAAAAEESARGAPSKAVADATPWKSPAALPGAGQVTLGPASASDAKRLARCRSGLELDGVALRYTCVAEPQQGCRFLDSQVVSLRAPRLPNASQASPKAAPATTPRATNAQDVTHRPAPLAVGVAARTTAPAAPKPPPGLELPAQLRSAPSSPQRATAWCLSTSPMSAGPPTSPTGSSRAEAAQWCLEHQSESSPVSFGVAPPLLLLPGVSPAGAPPALTQPSVLRPGHLALPLGAATAGASPTSPPLGLELMAPCGCYALLPPVRAQEPVEAQCGELGAAWSGLRELLATQVQRLLELDDPQQRATLSALHGAAPQLPKTSPRTCRSSSHGSTSARATSDFGSITDFESSCFAFDASPLGVDQEAEELLPTMLVAYKAVTTERRQLSVKKGQHMEE